jgi:putative transposase
MRYVERNALEARLVRRAEEWRWGSLQWRGGSRSPLALSNAPVKLPNYWMDFVNQPQTAAELAAIRDCVTRQRPFGDRVWIESAVPSVPRLGTKR